MASVIDYIECPHCKDGDAWIEISQWSEHMFCNKCGYTRQTFITNLDEVSKGDGTLPQVELMEENNPLGAYFVQYKDHTAEAGTLHDENSESFLKQQIEEYRDDIVFVRINSFENNEHKVRYLVGNETEI